MFGFPTTNASSGFGIGQGAFSLGGTNNAATGNNAAGNTTFGSTLGGTSASGAFGGFGSTTGTTGGLGLTTGNTFGNTGTTGGFGALGGQTTGFGAAPSAGFGTSAGFGSMMGQKPATTAFNFGTPSVQNNSSFLTNNASNNAVPIANQPAATPQTGFGGAAQFGSGGSGFGSFGATATAPAASTAAPSLGFGSSSSTGSAFSLGQSGSGPSTAPATKFFAPATTAAANTGTLGSSGFGFGASSNPQPSATSAFQLGGLSKPAENVLGGTTAQSTAFNFGQISSAATTASGLTLGGGFGGSLNLSTANPSAPATTSSSGLTGFSLGGLGSFGGLGTATTTTTASGFGLTASNAATSTPMLSGLLSQPASGFGAGFLGKPAATTQAAATTIPAAIASTSTAGFNLSSGFPLAGKGNAPSTSTAGLGFGSSLPTVNTSSSSLSISSSLSSSSSAVITTASVLPAFNATKGFGILGSTAMSSAAPTASLTSFTLTTTTAAAATTTSNAATAAASGISSSTTFSQLEDMINRWSQELQEQERVFLQQATQVNAWDRVLLDNGEKISHLNLEVEKVKLDQQRLEQDLDFILSQQNELEEALAPLQSSVLQQLPQQPSQHIQSTSGYIQHADVEREHIYKLTENIDAQLKRMSSNLKEIIDRINSSSTAVNSGNVMYQISKILNAHMDSLQWIDRNADDLQRKVNDLSTQIDDQKRFHSVTGMGFNSPYRGSPFK